MTSARFVVAMQPRNFVVLSETACNLHLTHPHVWKPIYICSRG